jgi:hypothetical protein
MRFGPFNGAYPGHEKDMVIADLDPSINRWHAIYDFNDPSHKKNNWRYLLPDEQGPMWCPLGKAESCIPRNYLPVTIPDDETTALPDDENDTSSVDITEPFTSSTANKESGFLHKVKVLSFGVWTVVSQTVCSIKEYCFGLVFLGLQLPHTLLSYCEGEDHAKEDKK